LCCPLARFRIVTCGKAFRDFFPEMDTAIAPGVRICCIAPYDRGVGYRRTPTIDDRVDKFQPVERGLTEVFPGDTVLVEEIRGPWLRTRLGWLPLVDFECRSLWVHVSLSTVVGVVPDEDFASKPMIAQCNGGYDPMHPVTTCEVPQAEARTVNLERNDIKSAVDGDCEGALPKWNFRDSVSFTETTTSDAMSTRCTGEPVSFSGLPDVIVPGSMAAPSYDACLHPLLGPPIPPLSPRPVVTPRSQVSVQWVGAPMPRALSPFPGERPLRGMRPLLPQETCMSMQAAAFPPLLSPRPSPSIASRSSSQVPAFTPSLSPRPSPSIPSGSASQALAFTPLLSPRPSPSIPSGSALQAAAFTPLLSPRPSPSISSGSASMTSLLRGATLSCVHATPSASSRDISASNGPMVHKDHVPGDYIIDHDGTAIGPELVPRDDVILGYLRKGTPVRVLDVYHVPGKHRLRGRLTGNGSHPSGWISLINTQNGYRYVRKDKNDWELVDRRTGERRRRSSMVDVPPRQASPPPAMHAPCNGGA